MLANPFGYAPPAEDERIAHEDNLVQRALHQRFESIHAWPQVGHPSGDVDWGAGDERRARQSSTIRSTVASGTDSHSRRGEHDRRGRSQRRCRTMYDLAAV